MNLAATIDLAAAASQTWDVAVVGAGPAGAMAAGQLAQTGKRVVLIDKAAFPRHKVCGCCLNRTVQSILGQAGMRGLVDRLGAVPINNFHVAAGHRVADLPLRGTVSLSRHVFDAALVNAAIGEGCQFMPHTEARLGEVSRGVRKLHLRNGAASAEIAAKVLVAADGVGSGLLRGDTDVQSTVQSNSRIGAGTVINSAPISYRPGTIYMACGRHGYVGLVRLENSQLDLAAALDRTQVKRAGGLGLLAATIIREAGFPDLPQLGEAAWQGTPLLTRRPRQPFASHAFLIGDAAGYVEPFTGEGIAWALTSGRAVLPFARAAVDGWHEALGEAWSREHLGLVRRRQRLCRLLARGLRHPRITAVTVGLVSRFPVVAGPWVRALTGDHGHQMRRTNVV